LNSIQFKDLMEKQLFTKIRTPGRIPGYIAIELIFLLYPAVDQLLYSHFTLS
jgi:hypothetical protein